MCHRGQCGAGWGFPDVTDEEEKLPGKPFLLLMCKIRKTTGEQADSGVRTLHREQTNHDQLRGPGFITSLSVRDHNKEKGAAQGTPRTGGEAAHQKVPAYSDITLRPTHVCNKNGLSRPYHCERGCNPLP